MPTEDIEGCGEHDDRQLLADTALVIEALVRFAGHPGELETPRQRRAWVLISGLADDLGMTPSEVLHADMDVFSQCHSCPSERAPTANANLHPTSGRGPSMAVTRL